MADGGEFSMSVNAKVTIPDTDAMYVVEVEETVLDAKEGSYSYVPTWRLSARSDEFYYHPVLVNVIDGSVIHIQDEL